MWDVLGISLILPAFKKCFNVATRTSEIAYSSILLLNIVTKIDLSFHKILSQIDVHFETFTNNLWLALSSKEL